MARYQITGVGVYGVILRMNNMMSNTEQATEFGPFEDVEAAKRFVNDRTVEYYKDEGPCMFDQGRNKSYSKCFRKGSELEWYNPLSEQEWQGLSSYGHGVMEVLIRVEDVVKQYKIS